MRSQYPLGNIAFYRHGINRMDMYLLICNLHAYIYIYTCQTCIHSVCQYSINFNIGQEYIPCKLCNAPPPLLENIWLFDIAYSLRICVLLFSIFHPKHRQGRIYETLTCMLWVSTDWSVRVYSSIYKPTARPSFWDFQETMFSVDVLL